ncbi:MAG: hypothetical protein ACI8ZB_001812 [Desulforhopalus sp.]|jgi:hypothetical protein
MSYCLSLLERSVYVGRYSWEGIKKDDRDPIAWSGGSYDVKIYKRPSMSGNVELLKPHVCVYSQTGIGQSISANPEKFAQHICLDFSLHIERVIWVEDLLTEDKQYDIVQFTRIRKIGNTVFYKTEKKKADMEEVIQIEEELHCLPLI